MTRKLRLKDINNTLTMLFEEVKKKDYDNPVIVNNVRNCSA